MVNRSARMPWFDGPSLLEHLETVEAAPDPERAPFRLPVQRVIRPHQDFRGFAGQIASGSVRPGSAITVWPSGRKTRVKSIESWEGPLTRAFAPMSVVLTLEDEVDVSRGALLTAATDPPHVSRTFEAHAVWMHEQPLDPAKPYVLKHTTGTIPARVVSIGHRVNMQTLEHEPCSVLAMNGIGLLQIETARPISFDRYRDNRVTGSAILIDPVTNATAGALMIAAVVDHHSGPVTVNERAARYGHAGGFVAIGDRPHLAQLLERRLFNRGANVVVLSSRVPDLEHAGVLAIVTGETPARAWPEDDDAAVDAILKHLEQASILISEHDLADGEGI